MVMHVDQHVWVNPTDPHPSVTCMVTMDCNKAWTSLMQSLVPTPNARVVLIDQNGLVVSTSEAGSAMNFTLNDKG